MTEEREEHFDPLVDSPTPPTDLIVLGRKIGTYREWDQLDTMSFSFDHFEPIPEPNIRFDATMFIGINFDTGEYSIESYVDDPSDCTPGLDIPETVVVKNGDLVELVRDLPKFAPTT